MEYLTFEVIWGALQEVGGTVLYILVGTALLEILVYLLWTPLGKFSQMMDRGLKPVGDMLRHLISGLFILGTVAFAVAMVSPGQEPSPLSGYWPVPIVTFLVGLFLSPLAPTIFSQKLRLPYMLLAPAIVGLSLLVVYPLLWELNVSFTNLNPRNFRSPNFVGLANYVEVFTRPVLKQVMFFPVFMRTILWTVINVTCHILGGMGLALLMNRKLKLRGFYRTLLVFPWAIPQPVACLAWRGEFHFEYGFVNIMLQRLGFAPIQWMSNPTWNFVAMCITNIWLGIPFMMVIILGGLQSIAGEYYEAAEIDGASGWQRFTNITLPLLRPVLTPAIILGAVWTFTNFNVPFFINQNELETSDTLVTALFRSAFQYFNLGNAAAFAFVNFAILLIFSILYIRVTGGVKGATE